MTKNKIRTYIIKDCSRLDDKNIYYEGDDDSEIPINEKAGTGDLQTPSANEEAENSESAEKATKSHSDIYNSLKKISENKDIIELFKGESKKDNKPIELVKEFNKAEYSGHYIGLVNDIDDNGIENVYFFHSRFDESKSYNFTNYILSRALRTNSPIFPDMQIHRASGRCLEKILAFIFVSQVRKAYKQGLFRCYRNFEENNSHVRGRIRVERHIKLNPIFNGKIAYTYREYTPDNDINRIIFTAYYQLCRRNGSFMRNLLKGFENREVKNCFSQLGNITSPASRQEISQLLKTNKKKIHHSVYRNWEPVRKTAIWILRHIGIASHKSGSDEYRGFLINMTKIWEIYLKEIMDEHNIIFKAQHDEDILFDKDILENKRSIKPDFLNENDHIVMDAKYKNHWEKIAKDEIEAKCKSKSWEYVREDVFQILSYMYIFDSYTSVILCPLLTKNNEETEGNAADSYEYKKYLISKRTHLEEKNMYILPLRIPNDNLSYTEFIASMKNSEDIFCKSLEKIISDNKSAAANRTSPSNRLQ